jgi:hypothetical protein
MVHKFTAGLSLFAALVLTGCQSNVAEIGSPRNSETGRAIASMDEAKRRYQNDVELYKKAMADYETANGGNCGHILFSSIVGPLETPGPRVQIYKLQGLSQGCGHQNYKTRITYTDDACNLIRTVEVLERMAP